MDGRTDRQQRHLPVRGDIEEHVLILRGGVFRSVGRWHAEHHGYGPERFNGIVLYSSHPSELQRWFLFK